jgi:hypothetical protein
MLNTTVFLLDIIDSNSLHGPVRELHQDNGISNQINQLQVGRAPQTKQKMQAGNMKMSMFNSSSLVTLSFRIHKRFSQDMHVVSLGDGICPSQRSPGCMTTVCLRAVPTKATDDWSSKEIELNRMRIGGQYAQSSNKTRYYVVPHDNIYI